jgi:hypothetical protein
MTRLKSISIRNFKAYKGLQEIPLKPLTFIFGPNSSGKSSIIHALAFLKHVSLQNGDCSPDEVDLIWDKVTLGGWQNLLHGHDPKQCMGLGLGLGTTTGTTTVQWNFSATGSIPLVIDCVVEKDGKSVLTAKKTESGKLDWSVTLGDQYPVMVDDYSPTEYEADGKPVYESDSLPTGLRGDAWRFLTVSNSKNKPQWNLPNGEVFGWEQFNAAFREYLLQPALPRKATGMVPCMKTEERKTRLAQDTSNRPERGLELDPCEKTKNELRNALKAGLDFRPQLAEYFKDCIETAEYQCEFPDADAVGAFAKLIQSHVHLGPSREAPPRDIDRQSLANNAQYGPWLELLDKKALREQVNQALGRLGLNYELVTRWKDAITYYPDSGTMPPKYAPKNVEFSDPKKQLAFQIEGSRVTLSHRDLGYGVSMVLPILVAIHSSEFDLITMEQPELHIHPRQQAELADELIDAALRSNAPKQLIIETHSEHILLRILRRIRETTRGKLPEGLSPVKPDDLAVLYVDPTKDGSVVSEIKIDAQGRIRSEWPKGFFEERLEELF